MEVTAWETDEGIATTVHDVVVADSHERSCSVAHPESAVPAESAEGESRLAAATRKLQADLDRGDWEHGVNWARDMRLVLEAARSVADVTAPVDVEFLARNIINQIGDLWAEHIPSEQWVPVRQATNDQLDTWVSSLVRAALAAERERADRADLLYREAMGIAQRAAEQLGKDESVAVYPVGDTWVVADDGTWLPGNYDSQATARAAAKLSYETLEVLQNRICFPPPAGEGRPITMAELEGAS